MFLWNRARHTLRQAVDSGESGALNPLSKRKRRRKLPLRILAIEGVVLVVLGVAGVRGYEVFAGLLARDLAAKAKENFENANYRMAVFGTGNLDAVESGGSVDDDVRLAVKVRAEYARGRGAHGGATALRETMAAAARKEQFEFNPPDGESLGTARFVTKL